MIAPEKLSLLFLHLSHWVQVTGGELKIEFILEEIKGEGNEAEEETLYDDQVDYSCDAFDTLQFAIAKITDLLHAYPMTNYVELFTPNIGTPGTSITLDDDYMPIDKELAQADPDEDEEEAEEEEGTEVEN